MKKLFLLIGALIVNSCLGVMVASADDAGVRDFLRIEGERTLPKIATPISRSMRNATRSLDIPVGGHAMMASYYGGGPRRFEPNSHMANGERFNQWASVCAHRTLPFGTLLHVSFRGASAVCVVKDRGPAKWTHRSLDVSRGVAHKIGLIGPGSGLVHVAIVR